MNYLCTQGITFFGFAIMHIYIAILAVTCFFLAFKGREKDTEAIVFSMLFHLFAWLCFIPIFVTQKEHYQAIILLSAIMVSNYGIIFFHFTPKWYTILSEYKEERKQASQVNLYFEGELQDSSSTYSAPSLQRDPADFWQADFVTVSIRQNILKKKKKKKMSMLWY